MIETYKGILLGEYDVALTGGTEAAICRLGMAGFGAMSALSKHNEYPEKASRPFDKDHNGFVMGEGAGVFVFEELEHAKKRGAQIFGEVVGYGVTTDASDLTQPDVLGTYASEAMKATLRSAKWNPSDVDYINAHGTATILGDDAEVAAIKSAFGDDAAKVSISSTKSSIGHLLGGSGAVEMAFSLMAMRDGVVPPTLNLEEPVKGYDLDFTPLVAKERTIDRFISNSFGFGGHNACIAVAKFTD
ncbi:MAG: hypothetical protein HUK22_01100 [Thermoguttaceae bacterium]|nr:hypothetical protein [Thermoguttaceae bacterium]